MRCPECGAKMVPAPVPGAREFPKRLECPVHGYPHERSSGFSATEIQDDKYTREYADDYDGARRP